MHPSFGAPPMTSGLGNHAAFARQPARTPFNPAAAPYGYPGSVSSGMYYNPTAAPSYFGANAQHAQAVNNHGPFRFASPPAMMPNQVSELPADFTQAMQNFSLGKANESSQ